MSKWELETTDEDEKEFILSEEVAEKEVKNFCRHYRINVAKFTNKNVQDSLNQALDVLQDGYRRGLLENNEDDTGFNVIQHLVKDGPKGGTPITYRELAAKHKRSMDGYESTVIYERQQALLGVLSGLGKDVIGNFKGYDLHVSEALGSVFFLA
ncbi:hypothetical protein FACS1894109_13180 [Spirochaetia bacterium]|nr:hypothetical protein FACS1894109_13180 [Spirochaetia bacterium]